MTAREVLNLVIMAVLIIGGVAAIAFTSLEDLQRTITRHFPAVVTSRDDWRCRAAALPGRRYWMVPTSVTEKQVIDALAEIAKSYPGWIPTHRLLGRGTRARWLLQLRRPSMKPVRPEQVPINKDSGRINIGLDLRHRPVAISAVEHTLVVGLTGSGKGSVMAAYVDAVMDMVADGTVQLWGVDLKGGVEMSLYNGVFDAHHAYNADEAVTLLQALSDECARRMDVMRGRVRQLPPSMAYPRIVLLIDEAAEMHSKVDRKTSDRLTQLLDSILRRGRALDVIVVAFSQDPRVESIPLRSRFPQRVAMRLNSPEETSMLLGTEAVERGATPWLIDSDLPGSGFVWNRDAGTVTYFRTPWYSDDDLRHIGA